MSIVDRSASLFRMDEKTWARHANPWSVWTRFVILPILALAIWSRVWLDWYSLVPVGSRIALDLAEPKGVRQAENYEVLGAPRQCWAREFG